MPKVTILTEAELRQCVTIDEVALSVVSDAFVALARGDVVMPPILRLDIEDNNGEIDVKTGRASPDAVTACDLTGNGVQDTAIARLAFQKALAAGLGTVIET